MKTATVRELRNNYLSVLAWVESGEEVRISRRGKIIARIVPDNPRSKKVDWSKSAALTADRTGWKKLTAKESKALRAQAQGSF